MKDADLNEMSVVQAANALRAGTLSARALTQACLARVALREPEVQAWVHVDADAALAAADRCDQLSASGQWLGPLHGIAVGVKDIFDVRGMPTAFGSTAWPVQHPEHDAASVARLRDAGAIVLGKTVTTSFAMGDPGPTRNPWSTQHTPGGSSSGSAAAVADRMCFAAVGTQTVGSVIRPCAFNGLAGIKPTHGAIDISGVQPLAWRLDHVGALTRSIADARVLWQVLRDKGPALRRDAIVPTDSEARRPSRVWRGRGIFEAVASEEMNQATDAHCAALEAAGVEIVERSLPVDGERILEMHQVILAAEAAAVHRQGYEQYGDEYPPNIGGLVREGQGIAATAYLEARQFRRDAIAAFMAAMDDVDALLTPAAADAAPAGLESTGDRRMNAPSSFLGMPVVCFPIAVNANNMPLGVQLMGRPDTEEHLLAIGQFGESVAAFSAAPGSKQ